MKVNYDKKEEEIRYVPENDIDIWKLAAVFERVGIGGMSVTAGKINYVSFRPMALLHAIKPVEEPTDKRKKL